MGQPIQGKATQLVRTFEQIERDGEIARHWHQTRNYAKTGEHFGINRKRAFDAVKRARADVVKAGGGPDALADELLKLDTLELKAWDVLNAAHIYVADGRIVRDRDNGNATVTDHKPVLMAIDRILKIGDQRAKLLGLYAPVKQTVTVLSSDLTEQAIAKLEAEMAERAALDQLNADQPST